MTKNLWSISFPFTWDLKCKHKNIFDDYFCNVDFGIGFCDSMLSTLDALCKHTLSPCVLKVKVVYEKDGASFKAKCIDQEVY